jgi:hypothetical protein
MSVNDHTDVTNTNSPQSEQSSLARAPTGSRAPRASKATREPTDRTSPRGSRPPADRAPLPAEPPDANPFGPSGISRPGMLKSKSPAGAPNVGGRPSRIEATGPIIRDETFTRKYSRAFLRNDDGTPDESRRAIVAIESKKDPVTGDVREYFTVIWLGDIQVTGRVQAFEITSTRRLRAPDWQEYVTAESVTNEPGARPIRAMLASMDLIQRKERAMWTEKLGATLSGQTFRVAEFLRILGGKQNRELMIQSQGPVWLDDGTPEPGELLDRSLVFVTRSRVFDEHGNTRPIIADSIPGKCDYYDLTPPDEITDDQIREGLDLFRTSFGECTAKYAAIPAAFIGQLFSGWLAAIHIEFWSAIHLTGEKGSGKSYYSLRFDSIQARNSAKTRGALTDLKPALNLGDSTGTKKGLKYNVVDYGGFTITCDDALKKGATETEIRNQTDNVSNLIRSQEAGGAALGKVDHNRNLVVGTESPALHSSVKVPSEIPIVGDSTLDRMIYLPHITETWDKGTCFIRAISEEMSTAGSRELMHRAYSAFVAWAFQRIDTDIAKCLVQAKEETNTWGVPARTADRYAAVMAGIYSLERFAHEYDVDMSAQITSATTALKDCARAQSGSSVPVALQWARELRRSIASNRAAFPGPPIPNERGDAAHDKSYDIPGIMVKTGTSPDGVTDEFTRVMPWKDATLADFGMETPGTVHARADTYGYVMPPHRLRKSGGKPPTNPLLNRWHVAVKRERFEDLCRSLSRDYGYEPTTVMRSLREIEMGDITNITLRGKDERTKFWIFDAELLRAVDDDETTEES